jgi:hypothetical protein
VSCGGSTSGEWSKRAPQPGLDIEGYYEWLDASEQKTGCLVQLFVQDERYRGWVIQDPAQERECQLRGYELTNFQTLGFEMRVSVRCPRAGYCPGDMTGSAGFIMAAVPGVSITGRVNRGSGAWRTGRWRAVTLVYLREEANSEL